MTKTVFLVGMPGSGKSTLGKKLAANRQVPFFDLDKEIESASGCSVADFFVRFGETAFRLQEASQLRMLPLEQAVVACGGGTPCYHDNMQWMKQHGLVIWINVDEKTLLHRMRQGDAGHRPIWSSWPLEEQTERMHQLYNDRLPFYKQAHATFSPLHDEPLTEWISPLLQQG